MKKEILSICFVILGSLSFAQSSVVKLSKLTPRVTSSVVIDGVATHNYSVGSKIPINGNPFLNEYFTNGVIELKNGDKSEEVLLRYNISSDLFEILRDNDTLTLNRPFAVKYIYLEDKVFFFDPKLRENVERKFNGFFQLRVDGKLSFYIKRRKDLSKDSFVQNYKGGSGSKEFYYIKKKPSFVGKTKYGKAFLISSTRRLLNNLEDHKAEVKAFIKENKTKFRREEDIVEVIEYYNSLI